MNCEICGRPKADDSALICVTTSVHKFCWEASGPDCEAHRVDWRERALAAEDSAALAHEALGDAHDGYRADLATERAARLAAESLVTASQAAHSSLAKALGEAEERAARYEAALRELMEIEDTDPYLDQAERRCDALIAARAALTRNAAERGEAFARTGDEWSRGYYDGVLGCVRLVWTEGLGHTSPAPEAGADAMRVSLASWVLGLRKDRDAIRNAALEEAAKACEAYAERRHPNDLSDRASTAEVLAENIRALRRGGA